MVAQGGWGLFLSRPLFQGDDQAYVDNEGGDDDEKYEYSDRGGDGDDSNNNNDDCDVEEGQ